MYTDNDIITDRQGRHSSTKASKLPIILLIITTFCALIFGVSYYFHLFEVTNATNAYLNKKVIPESELFVRPPPRTRKMLSRQIPNKIITTRHHITILKSAAPSLQDQRGVINTSSQSRRTRAQRANTKTCFYWNKKYNEDNSNYSKLMQDDACKRAAITVETHVKNIIVQKQANRQVRVNKNISASACTNYKKRFEYIKSRMRQGYTAAEYNKLEVKREKWQNKLFDECKYRSVNSY